MALRVHRLKLFCALLLVGACCLPAQSKRPQDLSVGKMLVTPRRAPDPLFAESVILLVQYNQTGALGLMVNRRTTVPISRALRELEAAAAHSDPVFVGGPVELETVFALARAPRKPDSAIAVFGEIYFISGRPALEKVLGGTSDSSGLRIYLGHCGWGPDQLENEVQRGSWYIFDRDENLAFDAEPATLWSRLIAKAEAQMAWRGFVCPCAKKGSHPSDRYPGLCLPFGTASRTSQGDSRWQISGSASYVNVPSPSGRNVASLGVAIVSLWFFHSRTPPRFILKLPSAAKWPEEGER